MLKNKISMQVQLNNLELWSKFNDLDRVYPVELMLVSQIIPFMFIDAKMKGAQQGLKGQCILVPIDLKKIQTIFPRSCESEDLCEQSDLVLWKLLTDKMLESLITEIRLIVMMI